MASEFKGSDVVQNKFKREILYKGFFYDVTDFIARHPGGGVIKYFTAKGEDATLAMLQFHNRSQTKVDAILKSLPKRKAMDHEMNFAGDERSRERYKEMTKDFITLHKEAEKEGLFKPVYWRNVLVLLEVCLTMTIGGWVIAKSGYIMFKILGALIVGIGMGRMGLLQHECGHNSVSGKPKLDKFLQNIFYGFFMGMSAHWWDYAHNRHHAMPQRYQRDLDLDHFPFFATHKDLIQDPKNLKQNNFFTRNQGILLPFNGVAFIVALSFYYNPYYVYVRRLYLEMASLGAHYFVGIYTIGFWPYVFAKCTMSLYLSSAFALSHTHTPITYDMKHWLEFGCLHTTNITPGLFNDWWLFLLNYQIEHHLFPSMQEHNLRYVSDRVKALALKYDLPFEVNSLGLAYKKMFRHLFQVQEHVRQLARGDSTKEN